MPVGDSGIWPTTIGIEEEKGQWMEGGRIEEIFDNQNNLKGEENLELLN